VAIASSMDSTIRVWDIEKQQSDADGSAAATIGTEPLHKIETGPVETWQLAVHPNAPSTAANLSKSETALVATTGQSGHVNIWNFDSCKNVQHLDSGSSKFSMSVDYVRNIYIVT